jgi:hypothetical protein
MKKYKNVLIFSLIVGGGITAVFFDQRFEAQNIDELVELSIREAEILPPREFTTDGCTLWPNSFFGTSIVSICVKHDMQYWEGGNVKDRKASDIEMKEEVNKVLYPIGHIMYLGSRTFGHPKVPAWWRWGYGFEYYYRY